MCLWSLFFLSACSPVDRSQVDKLNSTSYAYHYRNLDSTYIYAQRAYRLSDGYSGGMAEALNNMAFVNIVRMDYKQARSQLTEAMAATDNQVELLVAEVQQMRLCQRVSRNREFYDYRERANSRLRRISEERGMLSERLKKRLVYAETEYAIVNSAYYYYVGLERQSIRALRAIDPYGEIQSDTAQYLNYLYNVGAGGIITGGTQTDINQKEFDKLLQCYFLARQCNYPFFTANSLEAMSEHLMIPEYRDRLITDNLQVIKLINPDTNNDMLAGWMADTALAIFRNYGDVYQIAGAYRTLATCYMAIDDYGSALYNLDKALSNSKIAQAPDLVASIREQLSVTYSAVNDKPSSDYNRNIYIDLQEQARQDRYLESRADMLDKSSSQLNIMIAAVVAAILLLMVMLWLFNYLYRKHKKGDSIDDLLAPLRKWQEENEQQINELSERREEINEDYAVSVTHIKNNERINLENRAKISLVNSVTPLIDRIINEVNLLSSRTESEAIRNERYTYILELTDKINEYNDVLTHWIQLRRGLLSLHIESFPIQPLFDIMAKSKMGFRMKGVELTVETTDATVKADRVLTLFMINTLADNARKFTSTGGTVKICAVSADDYVEISVADTGSGIDAKQLDNIFDRKVYNGHGFGLMNCRGIIEKYRKTSKIFDVCILSAESQPGEGSRFFFRLPKGLVRMVVAVMMVAASSAVSSAQRHASAPADTASFTELTTASAFADSAYFSNIAGTYAKTLSWADSCRKYLNSYYLRQRPNGKQLLLRSGSTSTIAPEIKWFHDSIHTNYNIILDMRNESAIAALALHDWRLYDYNNKIYTQLFKEMSADNTLADYCRTMQQSQTNKTVAVIILILVLIMILPAYYLLYYRHRLYYRFCVERIKTINSVLLSDTAPTDKLKKIETLAREEYPAGLHDVVNKILKALNDAISLRQQQFVNIELAEDELRRAEYEDNNLYISNSVLDNCLSTLKHETMYYPSRIRQLVDGKDGQLHTINELVDYYRDLYSLLSQQAMCQLDRVKLHITPINIGEIRCGADSNMVVIGDRNMLQYMFEILQRQSSDRHIDVTVAPKDNRYLLFTVKIAGLAISSDNAQSLFVPTVGNIPYLLCRQIVRDHSEATNLRGCGIVARAGEGCGIIEITLPGHI